MQINTGMRNTKQPEKGWGVFAGFQNFIVRRTEITSVGLVEQAGKRGHNSCIWMIIMCREEIHEIPPKSKPIHANICHEYKLTSVRLFCGTGFLICVLSAEIVLLSILYFPELF